MTEKGGDSSAQRASEGPSFICHPEGRSPEGSHSFEKGGDSSPSLSLRVTE